MVLELEYLLYLGVKLDPGGDVQSIGCVLMAKGPLLCRF
jgi:hypothetical protein